MVRQSFNSAIWLRKDEHKSVSVFIEYELTIQCDGLYRAWTVSKERLSHRRFSLPLRYQWIELPSPRIK
jgi:hypothetical protein